jgi:hypothetical protein
VGKEAQWRAMTAALRTMDEWTPVRASNIIHMRNMNKYSEDVVKIGVWKGN